MRSAQKSNMLDFSTLRDVHQDQSTRRNQPRPESHRTRDHPPDPDEYQRQREEAQKDRPRAVVTERFEEQPVEQRERKKLAEKIIALGWKELARQHHPDKGGTSEYMARLNAVKDALLDLIEGRII